MGRLGCDRVKKTRTCEANGSVEEGGVSPYASGPPNWSTSSTSESLDTRHAVRRRRGRARGLRQCGEQRYCRSGTLYLPQKSTNFTDSTRDEKYTPAHEQSTAQCTVCKFTSQVEVAGISDGSCLRRRRGAAAHSLA